MTLTKAGKQEAKHTGLTNFVSLFNAAATKIDELSAAGVGGTLASANVIVGNASNVATARAVSGDATISNTGVVTVPKVARITVRDADNPDRIVLREEDEGTNFVTVKPVDTLTGDRTLTIPNEDVDLGDVKARAGRVTLRGASDPDRIVLREENDGANFVTVKPVDTLTGDRTVTFPDADVVVANLERLPTASEITQTTTLRGDAAIQIKDAAGANIAEPALIRVWISDGDLTAPDATDNAVAIETGTVIQQITEHAHYVILTDATGGAEVQVTVDAAKDRYVMVEAGGRVTSVKLEIAVIEG